MKNILLIVDPQNDFITGSLAVEGAKEKMMKLADYIKNSGNKYDYICVTMDSHPENHCSFKENGGIWPKHCISDTNGWNFPEYLTDAFINIANNSANPDNNFTRIHIYHKGTEYDKEEYSIFDNCEDGNTLANQITDLIREDDVWIDVCGIAGDYCVLETIKGLRKIIGDKCINVLTEYTASIDGGEKLMNYLNTNEMI